MNIDKTRVSYNFSNAVDTYDDASSVQKICAIKTFDLIKNDFKKKDSSFLLEIGAGTGIFSEKIIEYYEKNILLTDISQKMVDKLKKRWGNKKNIDFAIIDGESFSLDINFDFILSSSVFQWFLSLNKAFVNLNKHIKPNGLLAFSMYIDGTFNHLKEGYDFLKKDFSGPRFFSEKEVLEALCFSGFKIENFFVEDFEFEFSNSMEFFRTLKKTGTVSATNKMLSYKDLKKLTLFLDSKNSNFKENYRAIFIKANKINF